ncbi:hypothetical protein EXIGLDRAFT_90809 [Exidia glandulosa HHB12029]|uniref:C2H2-type domain-containing protein n=1 Tax=Exidia glandulosa HHB12029 TaxID=1314781 RepID=A0A165HCL6_EXIGL|nr:hypothetical protein EXIGLDRAFT_90809 [Exidia glandulosa HHB12029]
MDDSFLFPFMLDSTVSEHVAYHPEWPHNDVFATESWLSTPMDMQGLPSSNMDVGSHFFLSIGDPYLNFTPWVNSNVEFSNGDIIDHAPEPWTAAPSRPEFDLSSPTSTLGVATPQVQTTALKSAAASAPSPFHSPSGDDASAAVLPLADNDDLVPVKSEPAPVTHSTGPHFSSPLSSPSSTVCSPRRQLWSPEAGGDDDLADVPLSLAAEFLAHGYKPRKISSVAAGIFTVSTQLPLPAQRDDDDMGTNDSLSPPRALARKPRRSVREAHDDDEYHPPFKPSLKRTAAAVGGPPASEASSSKKRRTEPKDSNSTGNNIRKGELPYDPNRDYSCHMHRKTFTSQGNYDRHRAKTIGHLKALEGYRCDHPGCPNTHIYPRHDSMLRHRRTKHGY